MNRTCRTCPRLLTAFDTRNGYCRCGPCRKGAPGQQSTFSDQVCASCPGLLTAYDARKGFRRCIACRKASPGRTYARSTTVVGVRVSVPSPPKPGRVTKPTTARVRKDEPGAWWTLPISRAEFMDRAKGPHPQDAQWKPAMIPTGWAGSVAE